MGGTCTNDDWVPTCVLAHAARLVHDAEQFADYGNVGERPAVDFPKVLERARASVKEVHEKSRLFARLEAGGVRVFAEIGASLARTSLASRRWRSCSWRRPRCEPGCASSSSPTSSSPTQRSPRWWSRWYAGSRLT